MTPTGAHGDIRVVLPVQRAQGTSEKSNQLKTRTL